MKAKKKIPLGALVVDRRVWVREKVDQDHIRCLVTDLVNEAEFPPLVVDKNTYTIVGGAHRYHAYKKYHGDGWEKVEVEVELIDLPAFEENPVQWFKAGLEDNQHLALRLRYGDRRDVAIDLLKLLQDPESEEFKEINKLLKFTPNSWRDFAQTTELVWKDSSHTEKSVEDKQATAETEETSTKKQKPDTGRNRAKGKTRYNKDTNPGEYAGVQFNAHVLSKTQGLIRLLEDSDPNYLNTQNREKLTYLKSVIELVLKDLGAA